ncbi:MAG: toprim domain-containing protein, partial [Acidimicrobiales bacterium]
LARHRDGRRVVVAFDADDAGRAGSERLVALLADRAVTVSPAPLPPGLDLNEWARRGPGWARLLIGGAVERHGALAPER